MRVGLNLCWLVPGVVGGSEESTLRTLRAVPDVDAHVELVVFGLRALTDAHPDLAERFDVRIVDGPGPLHPDRWKPLRVGIEHTWLPRAATSAGLDVLHHAGGTVPGRFEGPVVLTVHDLQPLDLPEHFSPVKVRWLRWMLPRSVAHADRIVVPSGFVRDRVVARLGVDPERVDVVHHGLGTPPPPDFAELDRLGLPERFLYLPAITYAHKGHRVAIDALHSLPPDVALVLSGGSGPVHEEVLRHAERRAPGRVRHLGRVPEGVVSALYARAVALVWPSTYEGFGLPVLEAMVHGCPVVAVRAAATPEVVGDAGLVVEVGDPAALADGVGRLLDDDGLRIRLGRAGRERAARFSAGASAEGWLASHRRAANR